jgi:hypothetical protein
MNRAISKDEEDHSRFPEQVIAKLATALQRRTAFDGQWR